MTTDLAAVLALALLGLLLALYRLHRGDSPYDLAQLVAEPGEARLSLGRVGRLAALIVSTWGYCWLTLTGHMTEWYFAGYMLTWTGADLVSRLKGAPAPPEASP